MDATYCILWIDDQPDLLSGVVKNLEQRLNSVGMEIHVQWQTDFSEDSLKPVMDSLRKHSPYDLIMVDYDLGTEKNGHLLAKRIRNHTYGDMVFYSAAPDTELRQRLFEERVDGVFCMNRETLASEIFSLAQNAIRRVVHPNYMRGLVVGSVGELDALFGEIIGLILQKKANQNSESIREYAKTSLNGYIKKLNEEDLASFETLPIPRIIKKMNLLIKVELLLSLLLEDGSNNFFLSCHEVISRFQAEINKNRIEFAHARTTSEGGVPVFKDRNQQTWTPEQMKALLLKIREHYQTTKALHSYLNR